MKRKLKRWVIRLTATVFLIAGLLLVIVLSPIFSYANKTTYNNYTVFHNKAITRLLFVTLDRATGLLKKSEFYNPGLRLDICLNDGSKYPKLIQALLGRAFARGFYDKVIVQGNVNLTGNYVELNGYKWNATQLLAHEMTHCLQFDKLGFWRSKPIADVPNWKWEGYAEYISRQNADQKELSENIERLIRAGKEKWEIRFGDSTIAPREYYDNWTLIQYCMDIKKMTYKQILADTTSEPAIRREMMNWFSRQE